jgi:biotin carboxyl carrier protein
MVEITRRQSSGLETVFGSASWLPNHARSVASKLPPRSGQLFDAHFPPAYGRAILPATRQQQHHDQGVHLARTTLKMPKVGDAADAVVIMELLVNVQDTVAEGQTLFVAETDKTQVEVPSPFAGKVLEIKIAIGDEVKTGEQTITLET